VIALERNRTGALNELYLLTSLHVNPFSYMSQGNPLPCLRYSPLSYLQSKAFQADMHKQTSDPNSSTISLMAISLVNAAVNNLSFKTTQTFYIHFYATTFYLLNAIVYLS
jgi:hypothetical protein